MRDNTFEDIDDIDKKTPVHTDFINDDIIALPKLRTEDRSQYPTATKALQYKKHVSPLYRQSER